MSILSFDYDRNKLYYINYNTCLARLSSSLVIAVPRSIGGGGGGGGTGLAPPVLAGAPLGALMLVCTVATLGGSGVGSLVAAAAAMEFANA